MKQTTTAKMTQYISKETGQIQHIDDIRRVYSELLGNSNEFDEYRDSFDIFLNDYYTKVQQ